MWDVGDNHPFQLYHNKVPGIIGSIIAMKFVRQGGLSGRKFQGFCKAISRNNFAKIPSKDGVSIKAL